MNSITRAVLVTLIGLAVGCAVMAAMLIRPVHAAEYVAPCQDAEEAQHRLEKGDASHFYWYELETLRADKIMLFEFHGYVMFVLTRKGCVVSPPAIVDYAKDRGEPT